jgi:rhodanese-related sulfurtransferase
MLARLTRLLRRPRAGEPAAAGSPGWIEPEVLLRRLAAGEAPLIVDVRAPDEFDGPLGHIAEARNIPLAELPAHAADLAAARRPVVLVCLTDRRSSQAAAQLAGAGLRDVAVLRGGMKAWRDAAG